MPCRGRYRWMRMSTNRKVHARSNNTLGEWKWHAQGSHQGILIFEVCLSPVIDLNSGAQSQSRFIRHPSFPEPLDNNNTISLIRLATNHKNWMEYRSIRRQHLFPTAHFGSGAETCLSPAFHSGSFRSFEQSVANRSFISSLMYPTITLDT